MVVFIIYKFGSVWKIEKNVRFNDLGPARVSIKPTAPRASPTWDREAVLCHVPTGLASCQSTVADVRDQDQSLSLLRIQEGKRRPKLPSQTPFLPQRRGETHLRSPPASHRLAHPLGNSFCIDDPHSLALLLS
jgi:hypothetical protein